MPEETEETKEPLERIADALEKLSDNIDILMEAAISLGKMRFDELKKIAEEMNKA